MSQSGEPFLPPTGKRSRPMEGKQAAFFLRRLQLLFSASVPLLSSLETLERQEENPHWSHALRLAIGRLERGYPLSAALASPDCPIISKDVAYILRLGESSGQLEAVLRELAETMERSAAVAQKFRAALAMPLFQAVGSLALLGLLVSTLLPSVLDLGRQLGTDLGPALRLGFWLASLALDPLVLFAEAQVVLAGMFLLRRWLGTENGRRLADALLLRVPVARDLILDEATFRFAQGMSTLLSCGCSMVNALGSVAGTIANTTLREEIEATASRVVDGESLTTAMANATRFDALLVSVVAVGEETGALHTLLGRMALAYQQRLEDRLDALVTLLEPLILAFLGAVVTALSLLFFLPITRIVQSL